MDRDLIIEQIALWIEDLEVWLIKDVFTLETGVQAFVVFAAFAISYFLSKPTAGWMRKLGNKCAINKALRTLTSFCMALAGHTLPINWAILQWITAYVFNQVEYPSGLLNITTNLLTAWIVIRLATRLVRNPALSRLVAVAAWALAALNIVGLLDDTQEFLESLSISLGSINVSALAVFESAITLIVLLWVASFISRVIDQQVTGADSLTLSAKVLITKISRIALIVFAVLLALTGAGIDLTALTIFSGALGIGVGFGLQKIISNFVSGILLLLDKSVKPGDNIVVGETFGWIDKLNARYVSVITRDGTEHLIPNEDLIVNRVENWSYSNRLIRLHIPIGISYDSDVRKAIELCKEAAAKCERFKEHPEPNCLLRGFGDSSVDLEIRAWVDDPQNGRGNLISECLLNVWDLFHEHGIEIPFPQRDLHIKSADETVRFKIDGNGATTTVSSSMTAAD